MEIKKLTDLFVALKGKPARKLAAVNAADDHTLSALAEATRNGLIKATITGDPEIIRMNCLQNDIDSSMFDIVAASGEDDAAAKAVEMASRGEVSILMKGLISTDKYIRAILHKEAGLLPPKGILSHVAVVENEFYHKLLIVSDVAIIPYPDLDQKVKMCGYLISIARTLGIDHPKVALIAASEQVLTSVPACTDAAIISKMAQRGQIRYGLVEGPMGLDVAIDRESAEVKNIVSPVAGDADCLLFPNIDAGNVFYKMSTKMSRSEQAAIVAGAKVPIVLSSRGDSMQTKLFSIALAALMD